MKKQVAEQIDVYMNLNYSSLESILLEIKTMIEEYGPTATLNMHSEHGGCIYPYYSISKYREETDEEYTKRIEQESLAQKATEKKEKELLKKLHDKYPEHLKEI